MMKAVSCRGNFKNNTNHVLLSYFALSIILIIGITTTNAQQLQTIDLSHVKLPQGFTIDIFAKVENARSLVVSESGTVFVSTRAAGKVYALQDTNNDFKADVVKVLAEGLNMPNGIALNNGSLYVAEVSRILRFDNIEDTLDNPKFVIIKDDLPTNASHGWKFISFGPDGKLYVPIGAPCNICNAGDPFAAITRMNPDGSDFEIFARGVRNTVGFDWDPRTGQLWFTDNGRDNLGNQLPPDELNHAPTVGLHFGYPFCHSGNISDPEFGTINCSYFAKPIVKFEAHVAPLGIDFYSGSSFPEKYKNGMFIAHHGSWNRDQKIGYRVKFVKIQNNTVIFDEVFAGGFLEGETVLGRPVDIEELADGSILVSDDSKGLVYRIKYSGKSQSQNNVQNQGESSITIPTSTASVKIPSVILTSTQTIFGNNLAEQIGFPIEFPDISGQIGEPVENLPVLEDFAVEQPKNDIKLVVKPSEQSTTTHSITLAEPPIQIQQVPSIAVGSTEDKSIPLNSQTQIISVLPVQPINGSANSNQPSTLPQFLPTGNLARTGSSSFPRVTYQIRKENAN